MGAGGEPETTPPDHYFTERPRSPSARRELRFLYRGQVLTFEVDSGVFGSHGLDPGSALLIESMVLQPSDRVLDLGCGWGAIGIAAARLCARGQVILTDVNRRAVVLARANVRRNHVRNAEVRSGRMFEPVDGETFDAIVTNPPYHVGREAILGLLRAASARLSPEGRLYLVGKGSQGIRFYQEWLEANWPGPVEVVSRGSGYRVLEARREAVSPPRDPPADRAAPGHRSP